LVVVVVAVTKVARLMVVQVALEAELLVKTAVAEHRVLEQAVKEILVALVKEVLA